MKNKLIQLFLLFLIVGCGNETRKKEKPVVATPKAVQVKIEKPIFDADSAYLYVQQQVDFGPRFPNNQAHGRCAVFLEEKLKSFGIKTSTQLGNATTFNNKKITIKNIIGEYNPGASKRILLFAHWDSRPFADHDTKNMTKPILGANDGGSGVGILIEVARQLTITKPNIGVDIIFFDAEDYGEPQGITETNSNSWCLGSQYWSKKPHKKGYKAEYGILLDMVGSNNAYFTKERYSMEYAPNIVQKVWTNANQLGFSKYFIDKQTNYITDDHAFVNKIAGIPSIDIIHYERATGNFHPTWHTHADNMDVIDKQTLKVVGQVLLYTIYQEN